MTMRRLVSVLLVSGGLAFAGSALAATGNSCGGSISAGEPNGILLQAKELRVQRLSCAGARHPKALGSERMERKLRDALPGGDGALRATVWEFMRPMLSPALVALNRDSFVRREHRDDHRPRRSPRGVPVRRAPA